MQILWEALSIFVTDNQVTNFCVVFKFTNEIIDSNINNVDVNNEEHWTKNWALRDRTSDLNTLKSSSQNGRMEGKRAFLTKFSPLQLAVSP